MEIIHLSDPHFGTVTEEARSALIRFLESAPKAWIICSGDITQRARAGQFRDAAGFFERFRERTVLLCPGNHDIPLFNIFARLWNPLGGFKRHLETRLERELVSDGVGIAVLNSTRRYRHIQGEVDLGRLDQSLTRLRDARFKIVAFHHPMDCRQRQDEKNLLINRREAAEILFRHRVDLVLGGHIHDPFITTSGRYPGPAFVISVGGTCLSTRTRSGAPNSIWRYRIGGDDRFSAERWDLRDGRFAPVNEKNFQKGAAGWCAAPDPRASQSEKT